MQRIWVILSALILSSATFTSAAFLVPPVEEEIATKGSAYVIVTLKLPDSKGIPKDQKQTLVANLLDQTVSSISPSDFRLGYKYQAIPCISGVLTRSGLAKLAENPAVEYVELDQKATIFLTESVHLIRADSVHTLGYTGAGCVVGVLDTGVDSLHPDLSDDIIAQFHFLAEGSDTGYGAWDDQGHGTRVSGIITSNGTIAAKGVAPDAKIVAVKVLDGTGSGFFSDIVRGMDWVVANNNSLSVDVINMSLGGGLFGTAAACDGAFPSLRAAMDACRAAGIAVFAAAGNDGNKTKLSAPACITGCFSVGAVYDAELGREPDAGTYNTAACFDTNSSPYKVACFSNRNANLKILAPGSWIVSSYPGNATTGGWGTSFATPHCAGVAALLCQKDSTLSPDSVMQLMKNTGVSVYDTATGLIFKRVDALGAILGCLFKPGDANASGNLNLADVISDVNYIFNKADWPACYLNTSICWIGEFLCRGDWNGDRMVNLSDVIRGVNFIFNRPGGPWSPLAIGPCCQPAP